MSETHSVEEIKKHVRVYIAVFGALMVLTVVTVGVGYLELPIVPALVVGLFIALIKAGLVGAYFMHLLEEKKVILYSMALTMVFFFCMVAIFMSSYFDQVGI
jgi:cytochrome c oxidase subunit 4